MSVLLRGWAKTAIGQLIELNPKNSASESTLAGFASMSGLGKAFRDPLTFETRRWSEIRQAYNHFADGDVLLAKITPCFENGKAGLARSLPNGVGAGSTEFFVCRPKPLAVDPRYLLAWVSGQDFRSRAIVQMAGSVGHKRVPKDFLLNDEMPLAPYAEQQRIADRLDTVLARVDACRDRLARVAPLLKRFRQSVLNAATSGRLIDTKGEAERMPLSQLVVEPLRNGKSVVDGNGARVLRLSALRSGGIDLAESKSGNWEAIDPERFSIHAGDFLVSRGNGSIDLVGRGGLVFNEPAVRMAFPDTMIRVRPNAKFIDPKYLRAAWDSADVRAQIESAARTTAGIYKISQGDLEVLRIPLPSLAEQTEIVCRVESLFAYADRLEARLATARTAVDRLTPALLAKAFRGELVPQDPNDEPAAELLRRLAESRQAAPPKPRRRQSA